MDKSANTGYRNTGDGNTGDLNTGHRNTGRRNTGNWNTGHRNTGHLNTGHLNTGHRNTGDRNTGHRNTGDGNTGDGNTGRCNTGRCNTGDWNTGDFNTGCFNCDTPDEIRCFGKMISRAEWEKAKKPNWLFRPLPTNWVVKGDMTDVEKAAHPEHETTGGYLRENDMREEWAKAYVTASPEDIQAVRDLPGFDADVFEKITGLRL
jgi:hypothetical protein